MSTWLVTFTIYRYAIPLELTASLLLVLAMRAAFAGAARRDVLIATASVLIVAVTVPPYWGRSRVHAGTLPRCRRRPRFPRIRWC